MSVDNQSKWSERQQRCVDAADQLMRGLHHVHDLQECSPYGISFRFHGSFATFDFDLMTRSVIIAHEQCVRISVSTEKYEEGDPNLPDDIGMLGYDIYRPELQVTIHARDPKGERMYSCHPDSEDLIKMIQLMGG